MLDCGCLLDRLEAAGHDSVNGLRGLFARERSAAAAGDVRAMPRPFVDATTGGGSRRHVAAKVTRA